MDSNQLEPKKKTTKKKVVKKVVKKVKSQDALNIGEGKNQAYEKDGR
jgi:hypothetical protein